MTAQSSAMSTQVAATSAGSAQESAGQLDDVSHQPSVEDSLPPPLLLMSGLATASTWSLSELIDLQPAMVQAMTTERVEPPQLQPEPPKLTAPRKDMRSTTELDRRAEAWPALPTISKADLYEVVCAMPDATPAELADVIIRCYELDRKKKAVLVRHLHQGHDETRDTRSAPCHGSGRQQCHRRCPACCCLAAGQ